MKKFRTLLQCSAIAAAALFNSAWAQDENFHIYLAFGQSNMEGTGDFGAEDREVNARLRVIQNIDCQNTERTYGQWYTATPPLFGCWGGLSVADYFLRTMIRDLPENITVGIVPTAIGGSDIALFQKSAPIGKGNIGIEKIPAQFSGGYAWLLDLARKAQKVGVIKGIILHQGETNTNDPQWKFRVQEIVADLRADLNLGDVPFIAGELLYRQAGGCCGSHNAEIARLPELIPNSYVASASGLQGADKAHFTSASYREFGRRYASLMLPLVKVNTEEKNMEAPAAVSAK